VSHGQSIVVGALGGVNSRSACVGYGDPRRIALLSARRAGWLDKRARVRQIRAPESNRCCRPRWVAWPSRWSSPPWRSGPQGPRYRPRGTSVA